MVEVLPAPFGPRKATISPGWMLRSMPSTARTLPKCLCRSCSAIAASPPEVPVVESTREDPASRAVGWFMPLRLPLRRPQHPSEASPPRCDTCQERHYSPGFRGVTINAARPLSSRATGTRNGEHDT